MKTFKIGERTTVSVPNTLKELVSIVVAVTGLFAMFDGDTQIALGFFQLSILIEISKNTEKP